MQFAVVESSPGFLEPMVLRARGKASPTHLLCERLNGEPVEVRLDKIVHAGVCGDRPNVTSQWCPAWVAASMLARGYQPIGQGQRIAANPEEDEDDLTDLAPKGADGKKQKPTQGFQYQSGENKWTSAARQKRWKEAEIYRRFVQPNGRWSALNVDHMFGYQRVQRFIESYRRREVKPESFFWCMIFAALTASENTKTAEANLSGFARLLHERLSGGAKYARGLISFDEFARSGSGFQKQRYETLQKILESFPAIMDFLSRTHLQDRALRRAVLLDQDLRTPGLGITKFSFSLECYGQDVACLDRWMLRALGVHEKVGGAYAHRQGGHAAGPENERQHVNRAIAAHEEYWRTEHLSPKTGKPMTKPEREAFRRVAGFPWAPFSEGAYVMSGYGADRFSGANANTLDEYEHYEDALKRTEYYKLALEEKAPNPLCRAQWTMWEDVLRHHPRANVRLPMATHSPLFFVIEGEGAARRGMRRAELLHDDARGVPYVAPGTRVAWASLSADAIGKKRRTRRA